MKQMAQISGPAPAVRSSLPPTSRRLPSAPAPDRKPFDFSALRIQPKLEVSTPGDRDEREADAMADRVMRMPDTGAGLSGLHPTGGPKLQRACASCDDEKKKIRRNAAPSAALATPGLVAAAPHIDAVRGGQPLAAQERAFFEPRFGMDFSHVRIHTDSVADTAARSVSALAYTRGRDVVFRQGAYQPNTESGRRLMAHELTHVVQQGALKGTGPVSRQIIQRAVTKQCHPPSYWLGAAGGSLPAAVAGAKAFGAIAELFISADIIGKLGVPLSAVYFDNPLAGSIDPAYVHFLLTKNPGLSLFARAAIMAAQVSRPDVLTHHFPVHDFEEIKPNSVPGRYAGRTKVRALNAFYSRFGLPYLSGSVYVPGPEFIIASGSINGIPITVSFKISRSSAGLVVYDICVETDFLALSVLALAVIALVILVLLTRGKVGRIPLPRPSGTPLPAPGGFPIPGVP